MNAVPDKTRILLLSASSVLITLFLAFIDEGYYNFNWMTDWKNWIPFVVYSAVIFCGQLLLLRLFFPKSRTGLGKILLIVFGGAAVGFTFVVYLIFT